MLGIAPCETSHDLQLYKPFVHGPLGGLIHVIIPLMQTDRDQFTPDRTHIDTEREAIDTKPQGSAGANDG